MLIESQSTHHETDIISHFTLIAVLIAGNSINLRYPPRYVLVKLDRSWSNEGTISPRIVIPIVPVKKAFTINKGGTKVTVNRTQFPLTLPVSYAFTDYRSQSQVAEYVSNHQKFKRRSTSYKVAKRSLKFNTPNYARKEKKSTLIHTSHYLTILKYDPTTKCL